MTLDTRSKTRIPTIQAASLRTRQWAHALNREHKRSVSKCRVHLAGTSQDAREARTLTSRNALEKSDVASPIRELSIFETIREDPTSAARGQSPKVLDF